MNENRILLLLCISICSSFLGLYILIEIEQWSQYEEYEGTPLPLPPYPSHPNNGKHPSGPEAVVASALKSITESPVITYYEYLSRSENDTRLYEPLDFQIFYRAYLSGGITSSHSKYDDNENILFSVYIESLAGVKLSIGDLNSKTLVQELKERIYENGIAPDAFSQRLVFNGQRLSNAVELRTYNISQNDVIYLEIRPYEDSFYSIKYLNSDFLNTKLHSQTSEENYHIYRREKRCSWKRISLKPKGVTRFWPYSYHGTGTRHARRIADDGFIHSKGHKFNFGQGIYTTPDINLATLYAQSFFYNGSKYLILFENRVNPKTLVKIPFKKGNKYWVSPSVDDLKPYGILIKKIGYCK